MSIPRGHTKFSWNSLSSKVPRGHTVYSWGVPNVSDVGEANALWIAKERAAGFDARTEAAALCRLMEGSSRASLEKACANIGNGTNRLGTADQAWTRWQSNNNGSKSSASAGDPSSSPESALGGAIEAVVEKMQAPHLKPSGIEERLLGGLNEAAFGLLTLMTWLGKD